MAGLLRASHRGDDGCAAQLGELDQKLPDAAGAGVDEADLARLDLVRRMREVMRGRPLKHQRGGLLEGDPVRHRDEPPGGHDRVLGVGAAGEAIGDPLTGAPLGDALASFLDHARAFHADRHRQRRLVGVGTSVHPGPHIDVDEVDAGVRNPDQNFPGPRTRDRHLPRLRVSEPPKWRSGRALKGRSPRVFMASHAPDSKIFTRPPPRKPAAAPLGFRVTIADQFQRPERAAVHSRRFAASTADGRDLARSGRDHHVACSTRADLRRSVPRFEESHSSRPRS
jgi:hypothetical protein